MWGWDLAYNAVNNQKIWLVLSCIFSIILPMLMQRPINIWFRDIISSDGWAVLQPHLRVQSTWFC